MKAQYKVTVSSLLVPTALCTTNKTLIRVSETVKIVDLFRASSHLLTGTRTFSFYYINDLWLESIQQISELQFSELQGPMTDFWLVKCR
jgi:hypothetical protein